MSSAVTASLQRAGLCQDSALGGLAALANTSTKRNKKNAPNLTPNPCITSCKDHSSFYQPALSFPQRGLCCVGSPCSRREKTSKENPVLTVSLHGQVWAHMAPSTHLSLLQNPQPLGFGSTSQMGWLLVPAGLEAITPHVPWPSASPPWHGLCPPSWEWCTLSS